jgi:hypothetical protein
MTRKYPYTFYSKVRGVNHQNEDGKNRQDIIKALVKKGMELKMIPEPNNPVDTGALGLYVEGKLGMFGKNKLYRIGYIGAEVSPEIHEELDNGHKIFVDVTEITGGRKETEGRVGVNIKIKFIAP